MCLSSLQLFFCMCIAAANQGPRANFVIAPARPLIDERLSIVISGLPPNRLITVSAKSKAQDQLWWRSAVVFTSTQDGVIDLGVQAPVSGTYKGVDGMGLFWSMQPGTDAKTGDHAVFTITDWFKPIETEIEAADADRILGSITIERRFAGPNLQCTVIADHSIHGLLCHPSDGRRHPGVIVLGGSDGGFGEPDTALLLASRGFTSMALAYFGVQGLPSTLQGIPVEYFRSATEWMRGRPEVDSGFLGLFGVSRGAEAALLVGATYPEVKAVVARSPSHVLWEGVTARHLPGGPAWTYEGKPLPYVPNRIPAWFLARYAWDTLVGDPLRQTPLFTYDLQAYGDTSRAEIAVENIHGPVLLLSGRDDQIWPSSFMGTRVMERLRQHGHPYEDEHLSYDGVGHPIPFAYVPTAGSRRRSKLMVRGTPEGTALAQADSWPKVLGFLTKALAQKK